MEGKTSTETYDSYLDIESNHLKVFNMPARNAYQNKCRCVFVIVTLIILVTVGPVLWNNHTNPTESQVEKQKSNHNDEKIEATVGVLYVNTTPSAVTGVTTSFEIDENTPNQNISKKEGVLKYLYHVTGKHIISGLLVNNYNGSSNTGVQIIQRIAGVSPGIINKCMPKYDANKAAWNSFASEVISNWNDHHLVSIVWSLRDHPLRSMDIFNNTGDTNDVEERWNDLVNDGGHLNQVWIKQLDLIAPYLQQIQTAGVVAMLDILPWTNEKYGIWSGRPGAFGTAKLYKLTHDYLTKHHNLTSFIWIWSIDSNYLYWTGIQQFWPGSDYVDVVSVYMWLNKELSISTYQKLVEIVGDKPMSMEALFSVPTPQLLAVQPRWTWFTAKASVLKLSMFNDDEKINTVFNSLYVVNKDHINYFNERN